VRSGVIGRLRNLPGDIFEDIDGWKRIYYSMSDIVAPFRLLFR
jgi:hypothetical protein